MPVSADDAQRGDVLAPVTIVEFSDFQCPFCARVTPTLKQIEATYGRQVRFVFKHNPLPFHANARPAAEAARAVLALGGSPAFWKFHDLAFGHQQDLGDESFAKWAVQAGVDGAAFAAAYAAGKPSAKVDADIALAARVGANGTPAFRINGVTLSGAQPFEKFKEVIDQQLAEAKQALGSGTRPEDLYATLTNKNQAERPAPSPSADKARDEDDDDTVWKVPVWPDDPVRGPADALVTLIVFSDFQCPFCKRVEDTLAEISKTYGRELRIVWKDNPLPFHPRARPSAEFARFVLGRKGNAGFWQAHDALFESAPKLEDEDLKAIASKLGVDWASAKAASAQQRFSDRLDRSIDLASDFQARGTPHFFINGVRLSGAQPFEKFKALIDAQLEVAKALVAHGAPRAHVYDEITKDGKGPPASETKEVAAPDANAPFRGNANAKLVIQEFSDFQCPFCSRVEPTLRDLEKEFGAQIKIVYRHLPLPFHEHAELAAEASQEALAQKGNAGFWKFHDALFAAQTDADGSRNPAAIDRAHLEQMATELGLDLARFKAALDSHQHAARVRADADAASRAGINGTPGFMVDKYYLSGAQPTAAFRKLIRKALSDAKKK